MGWPVYRGERYGPSNLLKLAVARNVPSIPKKHFSTNGWEIFILSFFFFAVNTWEEGKKAPKLEPEGGVEANRDDAEQLPIIHQLSCSPILLVEQQLSVFAVLSLSYCSVNFFSLSVSQVKHFT